MDVELNDNDFVDDVQQQKQLQQQKQQQRQKQTLYDDDSSDSDDSDNSKNNNDKNKNKNKYKGLMGKFKSLNIISELKMPIILIILFLLVSNPQLTEILTTTFPQLFENKTESMLCLLLKGVVLSLIFWLLNKFVLCKI